MPHSRERLPSALDRLDGILAQAGRRGIMLFLDYDGVLAPIVSRPENAMPAAGMVEALRRASRSMTLAVVSGRGLDDVRRRVGLDGIAYAGSHGFEILTPDGRRVENEEAAAFLPELDRAQAELDERLAGIDGVLVERKPFAIAVHYRLAAEAAIPRIESIVGETAARCPHLEQLGGKKIFELRPAVDWHKGKAVLWLLDALHASPDAILPIYIGDDRTDEDAFAALRDRGIGIFVGPADADTAARYALSDPEQVRAFITALADGPRRPADAPKGRETL